MIRVQREDFDMKAAYDLLHQGRTGVGGVCTFVGLVRDLAGGEGVSAMTLEHYDGMTQRQLEKIEAEARERWPLEEVVLIHRYGRLEPGDQIVFVGTASAHREAAFESCHFLIDWLKTKAPFWKLEEKDTGADWVEAQASDDAAADRWEKA
ncbi:MAG: molybdenum cofactor biosynthesis protein MoaE [Magnetovibrionaceae bacterium]